MFDFEGNSPDFAITTDEIELESRIALISDPDKGLLLQLDIEGISQTLFDKMQTNGVEAIIKVSDEVSKLYNE